MKASIATQSVTSSPRLAQADAALGPPLPINGFGPPNDFAGPVGQNMLPPVPANNAPAWSPDRPILDAIPNQTTFPNSRPNFPPYVPPTNGNGTSLPYLGGPSDFGSPLSPLGRFGPPPPVFDPGFTPEVQIADLTVNVTPSARTLSYFAGVGFNSDQGFFGRLMYEDRDFDWTAFPWRNPRQPFRGGGQRFRVEAMPGAQAQRYIVSFEQPYFAWFGGRPVSFNLSGHFFERDYFDWNERRYGGRFGFGYSINDALSLKTKFQAENVDISDPRILVPDLVRALGDHELYSGAVSLVYDNRDVPYAPSSGSYLELGFEQVFGSFDYPRATVDYRRYVWTRQRPDRSGRHILGFTFNGSLTGSDTPIYDRLFAGGYATLRGFRFRHASPKDMDVIVGGELSLTGSVEYYVPVTADDMVRGLFFTDIGTVSDDTSIDDDDLRISIGGGLRIYIPALGPAPLAIDAAVPIVRADTDRIQNVHFYINLGF